MTDREQTFGECDCFAIGRGTMEHDRACPNYLASEELAREAIDRAEEVGWQFALVVREGFDELRAKLDAVLAERDNWKHATLAYGDNQELRDECGALRAQVAKWVENYNKRADEAVRLSQQQDQVVERSLVPRLPTLRSASP